jgi:hypothetical protein
MTNSPLQLEVLRQYANGLLGTRQAIERAGWRTSPTS